MEETYLLNYPGVRKKILAGGSGPLPHFPPGTKWFSPWNSPTDAIVPSSFLLLNHEHFNCGR
uniref:Uncharacterized protein n=1 Tax=Neolamprologus brichardi TaxID=32507 RepID=A0A3Q4N7D3_NEOBR